MTSPSTATLSRKKPLTAILMLILMAGFLISCGGGGGGTTTPIVNTVSATVAGYYTGRADVKMTDDFTALPIEDLRVFVHGSRIMAMGLLTDTANFVLYDITISSIIENDFTATATVYKAGVNIATANVTGTTVDGVSFSGTLEGIGIANGTFAVAFDMEVNARTAALSVIAKTSYDGDLNTGTSDLAFDIDATGNVISTTASINAVKFVNCNVVAGSSLTAIVNENLYTLVFVFSGCDDATVNGSYTGFVTIFDDLAQQLPNGLMPAAFSNGNFAGTAVFGFNGFN